MLSRVDRAKGDVPVEAPVAARLERSGEAVALALGVDAAVPVAPAVGGGTVLLGAGCAGVSVVLGWKMVGERGVKGKAYR